MSRKKETQTKTADTGRSPWPRRWFKMAAILVGVAFFLGGLIWLGQWARNEISQNDRYAVPFADIDCIPPPSRTRLEFLDEVRYYSRPPDPLHLLNDDLSQTLAEAFAKHPWVEKVEKVILEPPRKVQVLLVLRQPVLAVPTKEGLVAVDRHGIRLPKNAPTAGLPKFEGEANPPKGPEGTKWGDPRVEEAARKAAGSRSGSSNRG